MHTARAGCLANSISAIECDQDLATHVPPSLSEEPEQQYHQDDGEDVGHVLIDVPGLDDLSPPGQPVHCAQERAIELPFERIWYLLGVIDPPLQVSCGWTQRVEAVP
jgi:hypothetical protein